MGASLTRVRPWTDDEDSFMLNNHGLTDEDFMVLLFRSYGEVHIHRLRLMVGRGLMSPEDADAMYVPMGGMPSTWRPDDRPEESAPSRDGWVSSLPPDDRMIMSSGLPDGVLSAMTGRSVGAIRMRRLRLRRKHGVGRW